MFLDLTLILKTSSLISAECDTEFHLFSGIIQVSLLYFVVLTQ